MSATAYSMAVPAWRILFTNYIDKKLIGFEWSLEDVGVGIATATSASVGAYIANRFGFEILFVIISAFGMIATGILYILYRHKRDILREILRSKSDKAPFKIDGIK